MEDDYETGTEYDFVGLEDKIEREKNKLSAVVRSEVGMTIITASWTLFFYGLLGSLVYASISAIITVKGFNSVYDDIALGAIGAIVLLLWGQDMQKRILKCCAIARVEAINEGKR